MGSDLSEGAHRSEKTSPSSSSDRSSVILDCFFLMAKQKPDYLTVDFFSADHRSRGSESSSSKKVRQGMILEINPGTLLRSLV